jgi:hypothetical protein
MKRLGAGKDKLFAKERWERTAAMEVVGVRAITIVPHGSGAGDRRGISTLGFSGIWWDFQSNDLLGFAPNRGEKRMG